MEKDRQLVYDTATNASGSNPDYTRSTKQAQDAWALKHITTARLQPLIEVLDEDLSSFVTISEVNAFTASKPKEWRCADPNLYPLCVAVLYMHSLSLWIAYCSYGESNEHAHSVRKISSS
jgi:hypothetical protein